MFIEEISGTLMQVRDSTQTRYEFEVWFPYTKSSMNRIREGSIIAVKNFSSNKDMEHFSVLRITSVLPQHYALGKKLDGFPGFLEEAATNAAKDWEQEKSTEDTTKIVCQAVPSFLEIQRIPPLAFEQKDPELVTETNIPMTGEKVSILNNEWTERVVNGDLQLPEYAARTIDLGNLANSESVTVKVLWDQLIRTHFGIFAYTNSGKSNLLSTCTSKIFEQTNNNKESQQVKVVIYDLMGEYGALLIDTLCKTKDAMIVACSQDAMTGPVMSYWDNPTGATLQKAAEKLAETTILPQHLEKNRIQFIEPFKHLLSEGKIKICLDIDTLGFTLKQKYSEITKGAGGTAGEKFKKFVASLGNEFLRTPLTKNAIDEALAKVDEWEEEQKKLSDPMINKVKGLKETIEGISLSIDLQEKISPEFITTMRNIATDLEEKSRSSLYLVQGNDEAVRKFSSKLGNQMIENRRISGTSLPLVSFVYDEADQFIPQEEKGNLPGMKASRETAEQLARRGRKFGLGIGIATQRIVYLDTNVLGQPHTYLVSKLPRKTDRERIQDAFGVSDETLDETLRFKVGQWMLISHGATGIDGLPIPVALPDANDRIIKFLENFITSLTQ